MSKTLPNGIFPSQAVSDSEKASYNYGLDVASAIETEWFRRDSGDIRFFANRDNFHRLRLYARGEQSIQKYKDELSINGDLSYLNIDWKPVPIIPKFVDIVVNGINDRLYEIKAYSQDQLAISKRSSYVNGLLSDMYARDYKEAFKKELGVNLFTVAEDNIPNNQEELDLHMQLNYKQSIEIAEEEAINNIFDHNKYSLIKKRLDYDLAVIGIASAKTTFNTSDGIKVEYVDPADIIYSYTDSPYFDDIYYVGEIRKISIVELKKQFPQLTDEDIKEIEGMGNTSLMYNKAYNPAESTDKNIVHVLYFEYKTFHNQVYKIKETATGAEKALRKDDKFNPPKDDRSRFEKIQRTIEVLYNGVKIIGHNKILKWEMAENMTRPKSDTTKVNMSYNIVAPRMYRGKIESLVSRMT